MKKILLFLMAAVMLCACHRHKTPANVDQVDVVVNVDEFISSDNADMSAKYEKYVWYESQVVLNNYLDGEYEGVESQTNVFQVTDESGDPRVIRYIHTTNGTEIQEVSGFWIEDFPLENIEVNYEQALSLLNAVNIIKPHSRQVCLRKEIGPIPCNPQWIFGNIHSTLYIDAVDGKFSENDPAFPLGQEKWPQ